MPPPAPPAVRLLCVGALVLVWAVPVDPQWRVFQAATNMLSPSYSRGMEVPVSELRYPGYVGQVRPRSPSSSSSSRSAKDKDQAARSRRQYKAPSRGYSKQGTFALLRQLIAETANETRTAFNQIGDILGSQFADSVPRPASTTSTTTTTTTTTTTAAPPSADANSTGDGEASSTASTTSTTTSTTTTEAPYRISRQELFGILQRNSIGLGRLFRREYDQAMQDSKVNLNRFKQEFRLAVAPFLQPATTQATSTTTAS